MSVFDLILELIEKGEIKNATKTLEMIKNNYTKKEIYNNLMKYWKKLLLNEEYETVINLLTIAKEYTNDEKAINIILSGTYNDLGNHYDSQHDYENALLCYEKSINYNPESYAPYNGYGDVLRILGKYNKAEEYIKKAIELKPDYDIAYNNYAVLMENVNKIKDAEKYYQKALEVTPDHTLSAYNYANLLYKMGEYDKAEHYFSICINNYGKLKTDNYYYFVNYAEMLRRLKKYEEAKVIYQKVLELYPSEAKILTNYAILLEQLEEFDEAEKIYKKALDIDQNNGTIHYNYGVLLKILNRNNEADKYINNWKKLGDNIDPNIEKLLIDEDTLELYKIKKTPHFIYEHVETIKIEYMDLGEPLNERIKIGSIQLNYELEKVFPYYICNNYNNHKEKIIKLINKAREKNVKILVLPELSLNFSDIKKREKIINEISKEFDDMIIIGGSYYNNFMENVSPVIIENKIYRNVKKLTPSIFEQEPSGKMKKGEMPCVFKTKFGIFAVLICKDLEIQPLNVFKITKNKQIELQMIFVPEYNKKWVEYERLANKVSKDHTLYVILSNKSRVKTDFGGTSIYGKIRKEILDSLKAQGLKREDSSEYQIVEISREEGIIYAELDISNREPEIPQSIMGRGQNIGVVNRIMLSEIV